MRFLHRYSVAFLLLTCSLTEAQDIDMFRTIYYPAEPYGGVEELQLFVKQELVYPKILLQENIKGSVYITYLVNSNGKVSYKEVVDYGDSLFRNEAERVFDKILWRADTARESKDLGYEKIKFNFNPNKYRRLVKKRGYDNLPQLNKYIDDSPTYYSTNKLDTLPSITNAKSIDDFIVENFNYPNIALEMGISGRVSVKFIVEPYGKASNIRITEAVAGGCNEETIRLIKAIHWLPGIKNKKAVRTLYEYQLNFVHPGGTIR